MITHSQEKREADLSNQNNDLRECLKKLQKELFDIVDLKTSIYINRGKAERGADFDCEEALRSDIERIREELFDLPFQEVSKQLADKFQANFRRLKSFMERIDKHVSELSVFNEKEENFDDPTSKFSGV